MVAAVEKSKTDRSRAGVSRSPNYPYIDLPTALEKARAVLKSVGRHATGKEVLGQVWGLSVKSSTFRLVLAAVRAFGLLDEAAGLKEPLLKLSDRALDILADYPAEHPRRQEAIREAAMRPKIHGELSRRYGEELPGDHEIRRYLIRERAFNEKIVGAFIKQYKSTLAFAGLSGGGKMQDGGSAEEPHPGGMPTVAVGDYVQWTSQGVDQFPQPKHVVGLSEDGGFAFVEDDMTGLPTHQLAVVAAPHGPPDAVSTLPPPGMREDTFVLDEGKVILRVPERLSASSYEDLEEWVILVLRKAWRSVEETEGGGKKPARPPKLERVAKPKP